MFQLKYQGYFFILNHSS